MNFTTGAASDLTARLRLLFAQDRDRSAETMVATGRARMLFTAALLTAAFAVVGVRLVDAAAPGRLAAAAASSPAPREVRAAGMPGRADIVDRNGVLLATTLASAGLYADQRKIRDPRGTALRLAPILSGQTVDEIAEKLSGDKSFSWVSRRLTPAQQAAVNRLGVPGLDFRPAEVRVYPQGPLAAHVVGFTNIDNHGAAGLERAFESSLRTVDTPLQLTLDVRVQHILREELYAAMVEFSAAAAAGVVMDARNGEVLGMVSLPDYDPNHPSRAGANQFNRVSQGIYEPGSTFKIFTIAAALEMGVADIGSAFDATRPLKVASHTIRDFHPRHRVLSVPEVFIYSSNIGAARMGALIGPQAQRAFLEQLELLSPVRLEIPETGKPQYPSAARWRDLSAMTIAYGHGVSVSPLQVAAATAAMVNGGVMHEPTLLAGAAQRPGYRVVSPRTSDLMRRLMRLNAVEGSGKSADIPGYLTGGKTGTAEKVGQDGRYDSGSLVSSYVAAFPMNDPRYIVHILLDEPRGTPQTHGYATGGWVAAPAAGRVIARMAPVAGVSPVDEQDPAILQALYLPGWQDGARLAAYVADE